MLMVFIHFCSKKSFDVSKMAVSFKTATVYYLSIYFPLQFLNQLSKILINCQHLEQFLTSLIIKHKVTLTTIYDLNMSYFIDSKVLQQTKCKKMVHFPLLLFLSSQASTFISKLRCLAGSSTC